MTAQLATPLRAEGRYVYREGSALPVCMCDTPETAALIVGMINESTHKDRALRLGLKLCEHGLPLGPLEELFVAHAKAALAAGGEK